MLKFLSLHLSNHNVNIESYFPFIILVVSAVDYTSHNSLLWFFYCGIADMLKYFCCEIKTPYLKTTIYSVSGDWHMSLLSFCVGTQYWLLSKISLFQILPPPPKKINLHMHVLL